MTMIRLAINGAAGRMGQRLVVLGSGEPDLRIVAALEAAGNPAVGRDAGEVAGIGALGVKIETEWHVPADVMIDFSTPAGTLSRLADAVERRCAAVIGTTGLTAEQRGRLADASRAIPILHAPNMSVAVNLMFKIVGEVAAALGVDYDVEIVEVHHRYKRDAPSGTALRLAESIAGATGRDAVRDAVFGRHGDVGERGPREIGIHAVRGGDVVGEHTVSFMALGERLEITHRAHTRDTFARGALRAARFIAGKPPGLYTMQDVLGG